ncbi:MAG TPA: hypothetical protein VGH19_06855 [Verrucomicrobiae bacterium]
MKPTASYKSDELPCVATLYLTACRHSRDRLCMVKDADAAIPDPGLAIMLIGDAPLRDMGKQFSIIFAEFPNPVGHQVVLDNGSSFSHLFRRFHECKIFWMYADQTIQGRKVTMIYCFGQAICERMAEVLNRHHCICNLK